MADVDNTFTSSKLNNISQCHSSIGKNNQLAKPKLDRWKDLNQAIIDWMNNDAIEEKSIQIAEQNNFQFYDKIQKAILSDLFARFRSLYPKTGSDFDHEFPTKEVTRQINGEEYSIKTYFQYEFNNNETSEFIKLKTAHDPKPELIDRAIITNYLQKNERQSEEYFFVAALERDELQEIELVDNPDEIIEEHFNLLENFLNNRQKRTPGQLCSFGCDMASRCGQFPLINAKKLTNRIREVKMTKTNVIKLQQCERRAAWNAQYGIPRENYNSFETESLGTKFHNYSQKMLVNNLNFADQQNIKQFEALIESEESFTRDKLLNKYTQLVQKLKPYKNLSINKSEYNLGFTLVADGKGLKGGSVADQKVATIFMGRTDLIGRVGTKPIIIELKTRPEIDEDFVEAQLYALGASKLDNAKEVTVLHVYLTENETKLKERVFSESELEEAEKKYESLAKRTAVWIPNNALSVKFTLGEWCESCEFKNTCTQNRTTTPELELISKGKEFIQKKQLIDSELQKLEIDKKRLNNLQLKKAKQFKDLEQELTSELKEFEKIKKVEISKINNLKTEISNLEAELNSAQKNIKELTDEDNVNELIKTYNEKKIFYNSETELMEKKFIELDNDINTAKKVLEHFEEQSKLQREKIHPNLVYLDLRKVFLKKSLRVIFDQAGYDSNYKCLQLEEELCKSWDWNNLRHTRSPSNPYSDTRYMLKVLKFSNRFLNIMPNFNYLNEENRKKSSNLIKLLNKDSHDDDNEVYPKEDIVELGEAIILFIDSFLETNFFVDETKDKLQQVKRETELSLVNFKK